MAFVGAQRPALVRRLQENIARALPAEYVEHVDGWWLRHSAGSSWWRATVLPHGQCTSHELARNVSVAERFYAGFGATTRFQITPGVCPDELDEFLASRGYCRQSPMSLRVAATRQVQAQARPTGLRLRLDENLTGAWFGVANAFHDGHPELEWDLLQRVRQPHAYAYAVRGESVVAVGRAVEDAGWVGVFDMATLPEARGLGAARGVLARLAGWASTRGADGMYLQVAADNNAAVRLYESAGFTALCGYHYRTGAAT